MPTNHESGAILTVPDISELATRIADQWDKFNNEKRAALAMGEEVRGYVFGTDVDTTSARILPHKNRTHIPKLTQISDTLQSHYYDASLASPQFFRYFGVGPEDQSKAANIEAWVRTKLEQKKFRETTGRQLLADYVNYGNCFGEVDYVVERNNNGDLMYKGPVIRRISPIDIVFNPRSEAFKRSQKLTRKLVHIADIAEWPAQFPSAQFNAGTIADGIKMRSSTHVDTWIDVIKARGINYDGYGGYDAYFKNDLAEIIIYRGDIYDPDTNTTQKNRVVYIMDRVHVIRNEPSISPAGFDGLHHAGWRVRTDNLWAQGPLDNLVGMQYRIDHLENIRADVYDQIANPTRVIKGDDVSEPEDASMPGATYYAGIDSDIEFVTPDTTILQADTQIALYAQKMEDFAGAPPEKRGIRTPGEKTAFEVQQLDANASLLFVDKARNFERMLETMLREVFELMLTNFDGGEYVEIFDDETGARDLEELSKEEVNARGEFTAMGARHWERRNRQTLELQNFMTGALQDPKVRAHVTGTALARAWEERLQLNDEALFEPFSGAKEDARIQAITTAELQRLQEAAGQPVDQTAANEEGGTGVDLESGPVLQQPPAIS